MVAAQRALMASGDWVSDGRDVGSTVCPDADVKVFLTATPEERARRRRAELAVRGVELDEAAVLEDVLRRDELDSTRAASPLRIAPGAVVVDSSNLDAGRVADIVAAMVAELVSE
jgi:cytidylate kinase